MNFINIKNIETFLYCLIYYEIFCKFIPQSDAQFKKCQKDSFQCSSGICISKLVTCDGIQHCPDGSDETSALCSNQYCPFYKFRCNYGGCVKISSICNGFVDCADWSDESPINNCLIPYYNPAPTTASKKPTKPTPPSTQTTKIYTVFKPTSTNILSTYPTPATGTSKTKKPATSYSTQPTPIYTPFNPISTNIEPTAWTNKPKIPEPPFTQEPTQSTSTSPFKGCILPNSNSNNFLYDITCPGECQSFPQGSTVPHATTLSFQCNSGYIFDLNQEPESVCIKDKWRPSIPSCEKICKKLNPSNVLLKCTYKDTNVNCNQDLRAGTTVALRCSPGYSLEYPSNYKEIICLENGEWNAPLFQCVPTKQLSSTNLTLSPTEMKPLTTPEPHQPPPPGWCRLPEQFSDTTYTIADCSEMPSGKYCKYQPGQYVDVYTTLEFQCRSDYYSAVGEKTTTFCIDGQWYPSIAHCDECGITNDYLRPNENYVPWVAAIFDSSSNSISCWGTVISTYTILTAAHCIFDESNTQKSPSDFFAMIGKRVFSYEDDNETRRYRIVGISLLNQSFRGSASNYETNLALLETDTKIIYDNGTKPVCADWKNNVNFRPNFGTLGMIPVWIVNSNTKVSQLQPQQFPYISNSNCRTMASSEFRPFITDDKFCAQGMSVNQGDGGNEGNGFFLSLNNRKKFYIFGVISTYFMDINNSPIFIITDVNRYLGKIKLMNEEIENKRKYDAVIDVRFPSNPPSQQQKTRK